MASPSVLNAIYRATGSRFEQEFLVRTDADPAAIRLAFEGVQKVAVDDAGDLVLATAGAPVRLGRPAAYQEIDGVRRAISAAWSTRGSKEAGFRLGPCIRGAEPSIDQSRWGLEGPERPRSGVYVSYAQDRKLRSLADARELE